MIIKAILASAWNVVTGKIEIAITFHFNEYSLALAQK